LDLKVLKLKQAEDPKYTDTRGVKGDCVLSETEYFHPIINTNIDVMHSVFLGVVKTLFEYWFDRSHIKYSLKKKLRPLTQIFLKLNHHLSFVLRLEQFMIGETGELKNFFI
jgi:hypothetical protein